MRGRPVSSLMADYLAAWERIDGYADRIPEATQAKFAAMHRFLEREGHWLEQYPAELYMLLHAQPLDSKLRGADGGVGPNPLPKRAWLKRLNPPQTDPTPELVCTFFTDSTVNTVTAFDIDGVTHLAGGLENGVITVWRLRDRRKQLLHGHTDAVRVAVSLSGGQLATAGDDDRLRLWDVRSGECRRIVSEHAEELTVAVELADGRLAAGAIDGTIRVWDVDFGQCRVLAGHVADATDMPILEDSDLAEARCWVRSMAVLPDGRLATLGGVTVRVWDVASGECLSVVKSDAERAKGLVALPDGRLVLASADCSLVIWDAALTRSHPLSDEVGWVSAVVPLGDSQLATATLDGGVSVWDSLTWQRRAFDGHDGVVNMIAALPQGRLATCGEDHTVRVWESGRAVATRDDPPEQSWTNVRYLAFLPDGTLVGQSANGVTYTHDVHKGLWLTELFGGLTDTPRPSSVPLGMHTAHRDGFVCQKPINIFRALAQRVPDKFSFVYAARLLDGRLAYSDSDGSVNVLDPSSYTIVLRLVGIRGGAETLTSLPGNLLATGTASGPILIWCLRSGEQIATLRGHSRDVTCAQLLGDRLLITGSADGIVCVWSVERNPTSAGNLSSIPLCVYAHHFPIAALTADPNHPGLLAAGDSQGNVLLLELMQPPEKPSFRLRKS